MISHRENSSISWDQLGILIDELHGKCLVLGAKDNSMEYQL
jgi:hypothetical protein